MLRFHISVACLLLLLGAIVQGADENSAGSRLVSIEVVIAEFTAAGKAEIAGKLDAGGNPEERLAQLEKQGLLGAVSRVRLTTVEQSQATVQIGERAPVMTGRTRTGFGERGGGGGPVATNFAIQNFGTLISVTPKVEDDGTVIVKLEAERSRLTPPAPRADAAAANEDAPPRTGTITAKTTVRVPNGQTVLVSGAKTATNEESGELLITLSARVDDVARDAARADLRMFQLRNAEAKTVAATISKIIDNDRVRIGVDERTNTLIISGPPTVAATVEALLSRLDVEQ